MKMSGSKKVAIAVAILKNDPIMKKTPYSALRYKENSIFLLLRFAMVLMVHAVYVIEWEVYSLTKKSYH
jgi:hypothetical protein